MTITELRALLAAATPGPWPWREGDERERIYGGPNARLVVAAVNALPALLDVAEAAATLDATFDDVGLVTVHDSKTKPLRLVVRAALARLDAALGERAREADHD